MNLILQTLQHMPNFKPILKITHMNSSIDFSETPHICKAKNMLNDCRNRAYVYLKCGICCFLCWIPQVAKIRRKLILHLPLSGPLYQWLPLQMRCHCGLGPHDQGRASTNLRQTTRSLCGVVFQNNVGYYFINPWKLEYYFFKLLKCGLK